MKRGFAGAAALESDIVKRHVAAGKHRDVDVAIDHQFEAGDGADLRFHRGDARQSAVEQPVTLPRIRPINTTPSSSAATGIPSRFIPWAIGNDISGSGSKAWFEAETSGGHPRPAN